MMTLFVIGTSRGLLRASSLLVIVGPTPSKSRITHHSSSTLTSSSQPWPLSSQNVVVVLIARSFSFTLSALSCSNARTARGFQETPSMVTASRSSGVILSQGLSPRKSKVRPAKPEFLSK